MVASAEFVHAVDDVQYDLGQGPCLLAVELRATQTSGSLGGDPRSPRFGPRVGRMGVHSVLSLMLPDRVVGAMNVYSHGRMPLTRRPYARELLARPAAVAAQNAQVLAQSQRLGRSADCEQAGSA